jgi:lipopolysaccharide export LptBFGC system permease protein LptF
MINIVDSPFTIFLIALVALSAAAFFGDRLLRKMRPVKKDEQEDFDTALAATLTLLGLIIGFSFSMAVSRYDQRKNCEEAEANAIGTEFLRADLLPAEDAAKVRELLGTYIKQRITFYLGEGSPMDGANIKSPNLQAELWSVVAQATKAQQTASVTLAASGMNDVLNSQGYTQAAWLNRIPGAAWALLGLIAIFANFLMGYRERSTGMLALLVLPIIVSTAFFLIADIDSPHGGVIRVMPHNLIAVSQTINAHQVQ